MRVFFNASTKLQVNHLIKIIIWGRTKGLIVRQVICLQQCSGRYYLKFQRTHSGFLHRELFSTYFDLDWYIRQIYPCGIFYRWLLFLLFP